MDRVVYLDQVIARRRQVDPTGFDNASEATVDSSDFITEDKSRQWSLDGLRVWISYYDTKGSQSGRWVRIYRIERRGSADYLVAHCELRDRTRTFRLDRIIEVADRQGERHQPDVFFGPFHSPARATNRVKQDQGFERALRLVDHVGDDLKVLAFIGEADGRFGRAEVEVLLLYATYRAGEIGMELSEQEEACLKRWVKSLNPDGTSLRAAIARIASRGQTTVQDLWELSGIVASSDNKVTKKEQAAMEELRVVLTEEFQLARA